MVAVFPGLRPITPPPKRDRFPADVRKALGLAKNRRQPVTLAGSTLDTMPGDHAHKTRVPWGTSRIAVPAGPGD